MSHFEHVNHQAHGFPAAEHKSAELAEAAAHGECQSEALKHSRPDNKQREELVAFVPFYGGRPSNGSNYWTDSLGHGNSVVNATTKGLQGMAAVCSALKHVGFAFVGISNARDRVLLTDMLRSDIVPHRVRKRIGIIQFQVEEPVFAIFHLLIWGQHYVKMHNCHQFSSAGHSGSTSRSGGTGSLPKQKQKRALAAAVQPPSDLSSPVQRQNNVYAGRKKGWWKGKLKKLLFDERMLNIANYSAIPQDEEGPYRICMRGAIQASHFALTALNVTYISWGKSQVRQLSPQKDLLGFDVLKHPQFRPVHNTTIRDVYFSEGDQILRFRSADTLAALSAASNSTAYFGGSRKYKQVDSTPSDYMGDLRSECEGEGGNGPPKKAFELVWPHSPHVHELLPSKS
jgi:hypothetical protein